MNKDTIVMERLNRSEVYGEYHKAFGEATELPLTLRPLETWQLAHRHQAHENPFCAMLAQANRTCAACLEVQHRAVEGATNGPETVTCFAGLCDTAVPIKLGEKTIGFLQTGQVAIEEAPSEAQFSGITRQIIEWGSQIDVKQLREAYFNSKVLSRSQYTGVVSLLEIFGKHLSLVANQIALHEADSESPLVRRARAYIAGHHEDPVNLDEIADVSSGRGNELIALDEALENLAKLDPRKARVIELRFFGGLSVEETAAVLKVSQDTVMRDWRLARSWLLLELSGQR